MLISQRPTLSEELLTDNRSQFIIEPLEPGFGYTLGNSLRRTLLSSIPGAAVTSIRIDGVLHEFTTVPGVKEDVTDIILNLKKVLLKPQSRDNRTLHLKVKGSREVKASDIQMDGTIEVLNPNQHIATLSSDGVLDMTLEIRVGRGFCPADLNKKEGQDIGRIPIDSIFSPVKRVNFFVENCRVGQRTDYDRLVLEVTTDGRITPDDAVTVASAVLRHHLDVFVNYDKNVVEFEDVEAKVDVEREQLLKTLNMSVNEIELSVRAANCLNNANITTVGQLAQKSEAEMLKYRNFGKKSLNEIKAKLLELGLGLGLKFDEEVLKALRGHEEAREKA